MTAKNSGRLATRTQVCGTELFETHKPAMSWESRDEWDPCLNQTWFLKKH